jgi:hypothetical protein
LRAGRVSSAATAHRRGDPSRPRGPMYMPWPYHDVVEASSNTSTSLCLARSGERRVSCFRADTRPRVRSPIPDQGVMRRPGQHALIGRSGKRCVDSASTLAVEGSQPGRLCTPSFTHELKRQGTNVAAAPDTRSVPIERLRGHNYEGSAGNAEASNVTPSEWWASAITIARKLRIGHVGLHPIDEIRRVE